MIIKYKKVHPDAVEPARAYEGDACFDVVATSRQEIAPNVYKYGIGLAFEPPEDHIQLDLRARSSIHKTGLILANCIGTGDSHYRGEYQAVFYHVIPDLPIYEVGVRILQVQFVYNTSPGIFFSEAQELSDTKRGIGGFGSSDLLNRPT